MCAAVLLVFLVPADADPAKLYAVAPHASGVALAEVVEVEEYDERPRDGNKGVRFTLKLVRGTGQFDETITVVTAYGGFRPRGDKPKPSLPVRADSLEKGKRYWFAFSSRHEYEKYNQGVIGFWPDTDAKFAGVLEDAVKNDLLKWQPQYDPKTDLTYGHLVEKDRVRTRVEKAGKVLWDTAIPGKLSEYGWGVGLWEHPSQDYPEKMPRCEKYLSADTATPLGKDNELGVPPDTYRVTTAFDPETGAKLFTFVSLNQGPDVTLLHREYYPETGKPKREERFDWLQTGGKAAGAKTEDWYRKISRVFDPATGKVSKEEVFWHDQDADFEKRWVKVKK